MTRIHVATGTPICIGLMHKGLTDQQLTGWLQASQTPSCPPPEDPPLFALSRSGEHFTRVRQQLVSDADWYAHPAVIKHRLGVGIDHFLYSIYPLGEPQVVSAVGLFRHVGLAPLCRASRRPWSSSAATDAAEASRARDANRGPR
jgi:hypothetical protein